jgi:hypothetical protein
VLAVPTPRHACIIEHFVRSRLSSIRQSVRTLPLRAMDAMAWRFQFTPRLVSAGRRRRRRVNI